MAIYNLANAAGAAFRSALNTVLGKLHRNYLGTTDPSSVSESTGGMLWIDTNVSPPALKIRNAADSAWITIGFLNTTFELSGSSAFIRTLLDDADAATARATLGAQASDADLTAFAALSRTRGDLVTGGASAWERLPIGAAGKFLSSDGTDLAWSDVSAEIGWRPYDMVTPGDGNDGLIYDQSINGNVTEIVTPDFDDGYEYLIRFEDISGATSTNWQIQLYQETSAAYSVLQTILATGGGGGVFHGRILIETPRAVSKHHDVAVQYGSGASFQVGTQVALTQYHTTAQSILRARMAMQGSNTDFGKMWLYKRPATM